MKNLVHKRSQINTENQTFKVILNYDQTVDCNKQKDILMTESKIISEIKISDNFYTLNKDKKTLTKCEYETRNGKEYLTSTPNGTKEDNILNLDKF